MPETDRPLRFASALSDAPVTEDAVRSVLEPLCSKLTDGADLAVVFATPHHAADLEAQTRRLIDTLNVRVLVGVTVQGVIGVGQEIEEGPGLAVLAGKLPDAVIRPFRYDEIDWPSVLESPEALRKTIHLGEDGPEIKAIVLLPDPFSAPMVKLLPALNECFKGVPVVGGVASGARQPGGNRLIINGEATRGGAIGLAIGGGVNIDCTVSQGCRSIGKPMVITKAQRHVVQELGGRNALGVIQEMAESLQDGDRELIRRSGLLVGRVIDEYKPRFGRGDFLIRGVVGIDQDQGYFAIGDPQTRTGQTIQFHVRDARTAEEDFQLLLEAQKLHGPAAGALLFSCNGRGTHLFERPHADATMIREALGDIPLAGFFAGGEIGPVGDQAFLHGHTASLMVVRPANA
ncbi:MAG: FIST C-terminal domain-containing protein [Planctomycetes bacterium]|nr:FIST C-terminal domain-containing protein [Planctomycetota bacterium]